MKSSSSSATPMFCIDVEIPCDTPNNSNDAIKTDQSVAASSSIPSNLQQPLKNMRQVGWNSTFLMLDVVVKFETTFDKLGEQDFKYRDELSSSKMKGLPTDLDWDHARALLPFLRAFYDATLKLSGSSYVTSNYYFHIVFGIGMRINDKLNDPNSSIKLMASNMREKYHKCSGNVKNFNPLLFISMILDPRHKMDYVIFFIEEVYDTEKAELLSEIVRQTLSELFDHYSLLSGKSQEEPSVVSQSNVSRVENDEMLDLISYSKTKYKRKRAESVLSEGKSELEKYLEDKVEPDVKKFDLFNWWKNKSQTYPIISIMARDILAIPVSTMASEYAFSTEGRVLDSFQSSLTPKIVECLICAQNWLRASPVAIQKEEQIEEMLNIESDSGLDDGELTVKLNLKAEKFSTYANEKLEVVGCSLMHG
ncbi:zinc finger BED domain-containing protein RICESLEEPER 1-like [Hibiscus syriacus]|uniref:zinc finger BED domain-containing protein RICESLEEPER 1-like n=1 Tax=Hibiscus syriacus TaxID=106335 RepID=UPI00192501E5|nr:zinc finger BED domain-containing protein RICESLEEPER 1-like [Hibiscus syriacus]